MQSFWGMPDNDKGSASGGCTVRRAGLIGKPLLALLCAALSSVGPAAAAADQVRVFHINSVLGNDADSGRSATRNGADGPWRSLARLAAMDLRPGDEIVLACGSVWSETLTTRSSGTPARPIKIGSGGQNCGERGPTIDGAIIIGPDAWTRESSRVYTAPLPMRPHQLFVAGESWPVAHHPNRGAADGWTGTVYVAMPQNGEAAFLDGRQRGTSVVVPADMPPAGVAVTAGARVHIRTKAWALEERRVASVAGNRLILDRPTVYPAEAGWGLFLSGQAWMVDSPMEWHFDDAQGKLRAWWPGLDKPEVPMLATALATGVDLAGRAHVHLHGLTVRYVGTGLQAQRSVGVTVRQMTLEDTAGIGIAAAASQNLTVEDSVIRRTGEDAIQGMAGDRLTDATGMRIVRNDISDSGVRPHNALVPALPVRSYAAVYGGPSAVIEHNHIKRSGYIGIRFMRDSRVAHNVVMESCLVLNDCAGIYTWGKEPNNSTVSSNVVSGVVGNLDGSPRAMASAGQGIYLDTGVAGAVVENNTVTNADHGIQVHIAQRNVLRGNRLVGNRRSQIWLQATTQDIHPDGDVAEIEVTGNLIANTVPGSLGLLLQTSGSSTRHFGRFQANRYLDNHNKVLVYERTSRGVREFQFAEWQAADGVAAQLPRDADGFSTRMQPFALWKVDGPDLLAARQPADAPALWRTNGAAGATPAAVAEACPAGRCLRVAGGEKPAMLTSPPFALQEGNWYGLSVDIHADAAQQRVQVLVRRNGSGPRPYESLSDRNLGYIAPSGWHRQRLMFRATGTANLGAQEPGAAGARVDLEGLVANRGLRLARMELTQLSRPQGLAAPALLVNAAARSHALACPLGAQDAKACQTLYSLATGKRVTWPLQVGAHGSDVLWVGDPAFADADRDGIPDTQDKCAGTPPNKGVDRSGCEMTQ